MKKFRVKVIFLTKEQGGRNKPPYGDNAYHGCSKLETDVNPCGSWTMGLWWDKAHNNGHSYIKNATAQYIIGAPYDELMQLKKFELYEGSKLVATGEVLNEE